MRRRIAVGAVWRTTKKAPPSRMRAGLQFWEKRSIQLADDAGRAAARTVFIPQSAAGSIVEARRCGKPHAGPPLVSRVRRQPLYLGAGTDTERRDYSRVWLRGLVSSGVRFAFFLEILQRFEQI